MTSFNTFMFFTPLFTASLVYAGRRRSTYAVPVSADGIRCRMSGSDHPTATSSAQGSTEAGKCAVLGVNYGESEK